MITIAAPNALHAQMTIDAANAGKHVVCEKPLCMTLEEADEMIDVCQRQGVLLMYAEELFFTPKYVKAKQMADEGAFGKIYMVKQAERHFGPHSDWFWDVARSGGGAFADLRAWIRVSQYPRRVRVVPGHERRTRGATIGSLAVGAGEKRAALREAIDIRRPANLVPIA